MFREPTLKHTAENIGDVLTSTSTVVQVASWVQVDVLHVRRMWSIREKGRFFDDQLAESKRGLTEENGENVIARECKTIVQEQTND